LPLFYFKNILLHILKVSKVYPQFFFKFIFKGAKIILRYKDNKAIKEKFFFDSFLSYEWRKSNNPGFSTSSREKTKIHLGYSCFSYYCSLSYTLFCLEIGWKSKN